MLLLQFLTFSKPRIADPVSILIRDGVTDLFQRRFLGFPAMIQLCNSFSVTAPAGSGFGVFWLFAWYFFSFFFFCFCICLTKHCEMAFLFLKVLKALTDLSVGSSTMFFDMLLKLCNTNCPKLWRKQMFKRYTL